jgi:hypothetical protein
MLMPHLSCLVEVLESQLLGAKLIIGHASGIIG